MPNIDAILLCGLGNDLTPSYRRYLRRFAGYVNIVKPRYIVPAGAETQQASFPGLTEAEVMRDFLLPYCPDLPDTIWLCDIESYTSLENVWNFHKLMTPLLDDDATVAVYSDSSRALKLKLFASRALPWRTLCETCDMEANPIGQIISLGIEAGMCYLPFLHFPWAALRRTNAKRR